jgi:beta-lactamase regulating signal transducer with metallopeptidase domain
MNKITLSSVAVSILTFPVLAFAIDASTPPGAASIDSLPTLIGQIQTIMWLVFGAIAVIMFVVAGIMFLTAQGQPEKIQTARSALIWGIAGVVVGILAYSILTIIGSALNV